MSITFNKYCQYFGERGDVETILGDMYPFLRKVYIDSPELYYSSIFKYLDNNEIHFSTLIVLLEMIPLHLRDSIPEGKADFMDVAVTYSFKLATWVERGFIEDDLFKAKNITCFLDCLYYQLSNVETTPRGQLGNKNDFNILPFMRYLSNGSVEIKLNATNIYKTLDLQGEDISLRDFMKAEVVNARMDTKRIFYS